MGNGFIINIITYVFAMIGFIIVALYIYKQAMSLPNGIQEQKFLKIESFLRLSPTKNLYVIKAGTERFLIAGDTTNTTLISKLDENNIPSTPTIENLEIQKANNIINKILKREFYIVKKNETNNLTENK